MIYADQFSREELLKALVASVELQSHYASLLNMYDDGRRKQFASIDEWLARLKHLETTKHDHH